MHVWDYFNPYHEINIRSGGNLPHWEQGSVWYFVTFRLADALPKKVIPSSKRSDPYKRKASGRAQLLLGRDLANGTASASAVQTELDPPINQIKPFEKRYYRRNEGAT